jgi:uncharacterized protein YndB with AHSA1/START domain
MDEKHTPLAFRYTVYIGRPATDVWSALIEKSQVDQYYLAPLHSLELHTGGRISYGMDRELIAGRVVELSPPIKLAHTFRFCNSDEPESTVTYTIERIGGEMCVLHLSHDGFGPRSQSYSDVCHGWPVILASLKTVLETGKKLPWPRR